MKAAQKALRMAVMMASKKVMMKVEKTALTMAHY